MTDTLTEPPRWDYCGDQSHGAASGPEGCRGIIITPHLRCLAHLTDEERQEHFATLDPGSDIDYRGTNITVEMLDDLYACLSDPSGSPPQFGQAQFAGATFSDHANFSRATFSGRAKFSHSTFSDGAAFVHTTFSGAALFDSAAFSDYTDFEGAKFSDDAEFSHATFSSTALFGSARFSRPTGFEDVTFSKFTDFSYAEFSRIALFENSTFSDEAAFLHTTFSYEAAFGNVAFSGDAEFRHATFSDRAIFDNATFSADAQFYGAEFLQEVSFTSGSFSNPAGTQLGPFACSEHVDLTNARFVGPAVIEIEGGRLRCQRTQWLSTAALRLRHATVDLSDAVVEYPLSLSARPTPFTLRDRTLAELGTEAGVRVLSLRGIDAAHLVLTDVDLSSCQLTGTVHLDQLVLEGDCVFARSPRGFVHWRGWQLRRWTPRRTLAEEHQWRARRGAPGSWMPAPDNMPDGTDVTGPTALAAVYRSLRKAMEDGKNEPDAADFYYGEMEMRRADKKRPLGERLLLWSYWAVSGYGLRASRALGGLLVAMTITMLVMMQWGLAQDDPKPVLKGTQAAVGQPVRLINDTPNPVNPTGDRMNRDRFEKSLRVVINSVIFHSSGQGLTTTGTYVEMASRIGEPVLLGLGLLAIRGRVKR
ncbi:pentapeptide repeat-containing protein [Streptomyces sp. NPDC055134]